MGERGEGFLIVFRVIFSFIFIFFFERGGRERKPVSLSSCEAIIPLMSKLFSF